MLFEAKKEKIKNSHGSALVSELKQTSSKPMRARAGQASARGGRLTCRLADDRVVLGGQCVTVIEGSFLLP